MSERASACVCGGRETLPGFQLEDSSELLSAWSLAPVNLGAESSPGWGHHVRKKLMGLQQQGGFFSKQSSSGRDGWKWKRLLQALAGAVYGT